MVLAVEEQSRLFGRPPKLALGDQVLLCLMYRREYRTLAAIGFSYGVSGTTAWRVVRRVEEALLASGHFVLPGKKLCTARNSKMLWCFWTPPKCLCSGPKAKKQARFYSGKKKRHTFKAQAVIEAATGKILATAFAPRATHYFSLFKSAHLGFEPSIQLRADTGYQGLSKWHPCPTNVRTPHKKTKNKPLSVQHKRENAALAIQRVVCEHTFGQLKRFRILIGPYHNRAKRFTLRFNLLAALHNLHL